MQINLLKKIGVIAVGLPLIFSLLKPAITRANEAPVYTGQVYKIAQQMQITLPPEMTLEDLEDFTIISDENKLLGRILAFSINSLVLTLDIDIFGDFDKLGFSNAIRNGHNFILNLVNIFYIFILLAIAIGTMVGAQSLSVGKALPRLVIAIILSNFGLFAVKLIADFSQILARGIMGNLNAGTVLEATPLPAKIQTTLSTGDGGLIDTEADFLGSTWSTTMAALDGVADFIGMFFDPAFWFAMIFLALAVILFYRLVALWFAGIFAPMGVALGVLPQTASFAKQYWQRVVSIAFMGPVLIFSVRLAVIFVFSVRDGPSSFFSSMLAYLGAAIMLVLGAMISFKMGKEVSNLGLGAAQKIWGAGKLAAGVAMSGGSAALVAAGKKTLAQSAMQKAGVSKASSGKFGKFASEFGKNLKARSKKGGRLGKIGGYLQRQGDSLADFNPEPAAKPDKDLVAMTQGADSLEADPGEFDDLMASGGAARVGSMSDPAQQGAAAMVLAKNGKLNNTTLGPILKNQPKSVQNALRAQVAKTGDYRAGREDYTALTPDKKLAYAKEFVKSNSIAGQSDEVLSGDLLSAAVASDPAAYRRAMADLSPGQRSALAKGFAKNAKKPSNTTGQTRSYALRAMENGMSFADVRGIAGARIDANIEKTAHGNVRYVVNQQDPKSVKEWLNNRNVSDEMAAKALNDKRMSRSIRKNIIDAIDAKPGAQRSARERYILANSGVVATV